VAPSPAFADSRASASSLDEARILAAFFPFFWAVAPSALSSAIWPPTVVAPLRAEVRTVRPPSDWILSATAAASTEPAARTRLAIHPPRSSNRQICQSRLSGRLLAVSTI
jgi:hypothetical protein